MTTAIAAMPPALQGHQTADGVSPADIASAASRPDIARGRDSLELMLQEGEFLLDYAVGAGIDIETDVSQRIIAARRQGVAKLDNPEAGALVTAIAKLAAKLHPVTAETLRACREDADDAIRGYKRIVIWLAAFIIPFSLVSFVYTGISNSISTDIKIANDLAVTLHTQLDGGMPESANSQTAPPGSLAELQQFAATMRAIYGHARQLNWFIFNTAWDPFKGKGSYRTMQLPPDLSNSLPALRQEVNKQTRTYQDVRLYATNVQGTTSFFWGAVSACILPVLYALLGACAYVLRAFAEQVEKRTFALSDATPARFIVAGIGGGVVGLFSNFTIGQSPSLSPLAVAFLVGYAVDIFFSFLDGSMRNLRTSKPG